MEQPGSKLLSIISYAILLPSFLSTPVSAEEVWTDTLCATKCPKEAYVLADNYRAIGNKADRGFQGIQDSWAESGATVFAANIVAVRETARPRIFEGCTYPLVGHHRTPGYPIRVAALTRRSARKRYIVFSVYWNPRNFGPKPIGSSVYPPPSGRLQHGAILWFNDWRNSAQWAPYPVPKWPYALQVNVWNRVDGTEYRAGATRFTDYFDYDGRYEVRGLDLCRKGDCFYAYYVTLVRAKRSRSEVNINVNKLIRHLMFRTWNRGTPPALKWYHELIEISVAAEAKAGSDAKFIADITTMGR